MFIRSRVPAGRSLPLFGGEISIIAREAGQRRYDIIGEPLDLRIVVFEQVVVPPPLDGKTVVGVGKAREQILRLETLVLQGDLLKAGQVGGELLIGANLLLGRTRGRQRGADR